MSMLADIENAIITRLEQKPLGLVTTRVQAKGEGPVARYPCAFVATVAEKMRRIGNNLKCEPEIAIILKFKDLRKEDQRRAGIYPILEGVRQALFNQFLGLAIDAMQPEEWQDVTREEDRQQGFIVIAMKVKTGYLVNTVDDSDLAATQDLVSVALKYYLQPDVNSDDAADAEDDVTTT